MTQKEKGYAGLGIMVALGAVTVLGSEPLYKAIDRIGAKMVVYTPGTYVGMAEGFGGEVKVVVTISESGIESVELTGDDETPELGGKALKKLCSAFIEAQSADVDTVSGSTVTCNGAREAVRAALNQAR